MKLIEARNHYRATLGKYYTTAEIDFYFKSIVSTVLKIDPLLIALQPDLELDVSKKNHLTRILKALLQEQPLQYLVGQVAFRKLNLKVNPKVLIPRPETEELVDWVLEDYADIRNHVEVIDLGSGSGCIALSLKKEQPLFQVYALDLQMEILEVIKENALLNQLEVSCISWDMNQLEKLELKVDLIVSNPPYISPQEKNEMKKNVLDYEPHQALFVPQEKPLLFYQKILNYAQTKLKFGGKIYFEINPLFESELETLISSFGLYSLKKRKDIFGKMRIFRLEKIK